VRFPRATRPGHHARHRPGGEPTECTAARALGIGGTKAYELAECGQLPCRVLRVGRFYHVPTTGLLELLGITHLTDNTDTEQASATSHQHRPTTVTTTT
jgi:hypothetical protein